MDEQLFYSGIDMYLCTAKPFLPFDANPSVRFVGLIGRVHQSSYLLSGTITCSSPLL
jgi:hypothetical protein